MIAIENRTLKKKAGLFRRRKHKPLFIEIHPTTRGISCRTCISVSQGRRRDGQRCRGWDWTTRPRRTFLFLPPLAGKRLENKQSKTNRVCVSNTAGVFFGGGGGGVFAFRGGVLSCMNRWARSRRAPQNSSRLASPRRRGRRPWSTSSWLPTRPSGASRVPSPRFTLTPSLYTQRLFLEKPVSPGAGVLEWQRHSLGLPSAVALCQSCGRVTLGCIYAMPAGRSELVFARPSQKNALDPRF